MAGLKRVVDQAERQAIRRSALLEGRALLLGSATMALASPSLRSRHLLRHVGIGGSLPLVDVWGQAVGVSHQDALVGARRYVRLDRAVSVLYGAPEGSEKQLASAGFKGIEIRKDVKLIPRKGEQ